MTIGTTKILFTGDISPSSEQIILENALSTIAILKVPHHGSKNGLIEPFLQAVSPKIAVISSGKTNSYGHPSPEIIRLLEKYSVTIRRTDQEGDIVYRF
jgi:competence protein ComEC